MPSVCRTSTAWMVVAVLLLIVLLLFPPAVFAPAALAQENGVSLRDEIATCNFASGKQVSLRYNVIAAGRGEGLPMGKVWMPGGSAMALFTDATLVVAGAEIPPGGYTAYLLPDKKGWKFIISRNAALGRPYDDRQDLVRAPMEAGTLSQGEEHLKFMFARAGPKQCEMNTDFGKTKAWLVLAEK